MIHIPALFAFLISSFLFGLQVVHGEKYQAEEVINKSPIKILTLRGFRTEEHFVSTPDGYFVNAVRIIHPHHSPNKRPVIFNHGLLESSTIWLMSSRDVQPLDLNGCGEIPSDPNAYNGTFYVNGPMMLASAGYDVWLMSMRGTDYALAHGKTPPPHSAFWDYTLDDFALRDVPSMINYVRRETGALKVGYVGHSQATFAIFALLATIPKYAEVVEPVIAVAPVAYVSDISSIARILFRFADLIDAHANKPARFPYDASFLRRLSGKACKQNLLPPQLLACNVVQMLVAGSGDNIPRGHFTHLPFFSSWKVLRHFGQLIKAKKWQRYDYGPEINSQMYGRVTVPQYNEGAITSNSLVLIYSLTDTLAVPSNVDTFKQGLNVSVYRDIFINKKINHFNLISAEESRNLVFKPMLEIFEEFETKSGNCPKSSPHNNKAVDELKATTAKIELDSALIKKEASASSATTKKSTSFKTILAPSVDDKKPPGVESASSSTTS